jgi:hypothetical protein
MFLIVCCLRRPLEGVLGDVVGLLQGFVVHLRDVGRFLQDVVGIPPDVLDFRFLIASAGASRRS